MDALGGVDLRGGVRRRLGVGNLGDAESVNHLNAKNPFTGARIPEPGRVFFGDVSFTF